MARKLVVTIVGDASSLQRALRGANTDAHRFDRSLNQSFRGMAAGSGALKSLGRSLAFASGGFIAAAGATDLLRGSLEQATERVATERKLAAQFKASGLQLGLYKQRIDEASSSLSRLAGIEDDELVAAFTTAFRGSQNVTAALKIQAAAADVMRGTGKDLTTITGALTKAYGGNTGALRRLNIQVPSTLKGLEAIAFVQERFKGQAAAGTTAQDRFNAAFKNTQEIIGLALLPTFNRLLDSASKWLSDTKNQKKIQHAANETVKITGQVLKITAGAFKVYSSAMKPVIAQMRALADTGRAVFDVFNALKGVLGHLGIGGGGGGGLSGLQGPVGSRTAPGIPSGLVGPITPGALPPSQRPGLRGQFMRSQLALAQAQITAAKQDDRRELANQARILKAIIAQTTNLKKRTALYSQLGSVEEQIRAIDAQAEAARKDAREKELAARKREAEKLRDHLAKIREHESRLRDRIKGIQDQFRQAVDAARDGIGSLFSGSVVNPSDDIRRRILGVGRPISQDPKKLVADVNAQVREFTRRQREITALQKLAPKGLRSQLGKELAGVGIEQLDALAGASPGQRKAFIRAFAARERAAAKVARVQMTAQLVTLHAAKVDLARLHKQEIHVKSELHVDGKKIAESTTKHQQRRDKINSPSRRGRNAGKG